LLAGASASVAADVYALGASLYTVLAGRVPFPAAELGAKLRAIREDDPPLPRALRPEVPKALQAICLKAMERAPADRYASAAELAADLERFAKGDVVQALPVRSRQLLRRKIDLHLADHADWHEQGLLDERQRAALQQAYECLDEQAHGLLRGVLGSLPSLLLLVGILVSVFGPTVLLVVTWDEQDPFFRLALPAVPLLLLAALGVRRARDDDRRRAIACLAGAALLIAPLAFALADLVPALRAVVDATGTRHAIVPGPLWLPSDGSPAWLQTGALLLEWKLLITALSTVVVAALLYRRLRAAVFLWIVCLGGLGTVACGALAAGFGELPVGARWALAGLGSLATLAIGVHFDRSFRRDRAHPFYGMGFLAAILVVGTYAEHNLPMALFGVAQEPVGGLWSVTVHGLAFVAGGVLLHWRGTPLLQKTAGAPLFVGLLLTLGGLGPLSSTHAPYYEALLIAGCLGFLVLGLAVHRNSLVLPAAVALPIAIGSVSQRHVQALWAWAAAVVIGGAVLVLLSFRLSARRVIS